MDKKGIRIRCEGNIGGGGVKELMGQEEGLRVRACCRCLVTVLRQAGASRERILVLIDGPHQQVTDLLDLLQVRL